MQICRVVSPHAPGPGSLNLVRSERVSEAGGVDFPIPWRQGLATALMLANGMQVGVAWCWFQAEASEELCVYLPPWNFCHYHETSFLWLVALVLSAWLPAQAHMERTRTHTSAEISQSQPESQLKAANSPVTPKCESGKCLLLCY